MTTISRRPGAAERDPARFARRRRIRDLSLSIGTPILLLAVWQLGVDLTTAMPQFLGSLMQPDVVELTLTDSGGRQVHGLVHKPSGSWARLTPRRVRGARRLVRAGAGGRRRPFPDVRPDPVRCGPGLLGPGGERRALFRAHRRPPESRPPGGRRVPPAAVAHPCGRGPAGRRGGGTRLRRRPGPARRYNPLSLGA